MSLPIVIPPFIASLATTYKMKLSTAAECYTDVETGSSYRETICYECEYDNLFSCETCYACADQVVDENLTRE